MSNKPGFTLVEIMVVVAIIGMLAAISIPSYVRSRRNTQINACISNLMEFDGAKDRWAIENKKVVGDVPVWADVVPFFLKKTVPCPAGGTYALNPIGINPTCSIGGAHTL